MDPEQQKPKKHRALKGYEVCIHTCAENGCVSPKTSTILWKREGHACWRHGCSSNLHPSCHSGCPGAEFLEKRRDAGVAREPTAEEEILAGIVTVNLQVENVRKFERPTPTGTPRSITPEHRPLRIVFVPDPNLELRSKTAAISDLSFVQQVLDESEYASMKHLEGSIHVISVTGQGSKKNVNKSLIYRVAMQEWVSAHEM
jgi:hypothetical protein